MKKTFNHAEYMQILQKIKDQRILHTAFHNGLKQLNQLYMCAEIGANNGAYIPAESRSGKSSLLAMFENQHKPVITDDGIEIPVLKVEMPTKPSVKGVAAMILEKMGDPFSTRGTEYQLTIRLMTLIKECKVKVLCIDEFQNLVDKSSNFKVQHHVSDFIKSIINLTNVVVVLSGLEYGKEILNKNEALRGRIPQTIPLPRFDWQDNALRNEFLGLYDAIITLYSTDFEFDILEDSEMAFRLFVASGGLTGYLFNIVFFAAVDAVSEGRNVVYLRDFAASYIKSVSEEDRHDSNPFEPNFNSTNYAYLEASKKVGRRADTYAPHQSRYKPKSFNEAIMAGA